MQGLLLINKPKGITSFKAVSIIKRLSREKRVGHTGTLDPLATGVLPIFIGRATALSSYLIEADKTYLAGIKLGVTSNTFDITGELTENNEVFVSEAELDKAINSFLGEILQTPPMFSAIKRDGVRLYELARKGEEIEIEPRRVTIFEIERVGEFINNEFLIRVKCSKGTYIRSLCSDIGKKLGCGAVMTGLVREDTHGFTLRDCVKLDDLNEENIAQYILPEDAAVNFLRAVNVTQKQAVRFSNGGQLDVARLKIDDPTDNEVFRVNCADKFLGLGRYSAAENLLLIQCVINQYKV